MGKDIPVSKDKTLFTPGPLTTSATVKQAMLRDLGSRDFAFIGVIRSVRDKLLALAGVASPEYEAVLMQGSGTFSIEAVIASFTPPDGKWLVAINGAYGKRFSAIAKTLKIDVVELEFPEHTTPNLAAIENALKSDAAITGVSMVHCETTSGIINPVKEVGALAKKYCKRYFVDAMSSFGAVPLNVADCHIDFMVSSANKCIEGVPGFGFIVARREAMLASEGWARSVVLDILAQWKGLDANGQFRFTPPTHAIIAFSRALEELEIEGGVAGRAARYRENYDTLVSGMRALGFHEFLKPEAQGYIITSFYYPEHPNFKFEEFYERLNNDGYVIYPGKVGAADCFRIGSIGRIFPGDMRALLAAIRRYLEDAGILTEGVIRC